MLTTKSSAKFSIVELFLANVKLFVFQSPPSTIVTWSPVAGVAGKVIVKAPPEVSAIIASRFTAV